MSEEADLSAAILAVFAGLSSVASGMKPALEDAMAELAGIASLAETLPEVGASSSRVMEPSRISSPRLLARMREGAFRPIVASSPRASPDLELVHPEIVAAVALRHRHGDRRSRRRRSRR
jgi:hypothetical protein